MRRSAGFGLVLSVLALFLQLATPLAAVRAMAAGPATPFPICSAPDPSAPQAPGDHHHDGSDACCTLCHVAHAFDMPIDAAPAVAAPRPTLRLAFAPHAAPRKIPARFRFSAPPRAPPIFFS